MSLLSEFAVEKRADSFYGGPSRAPVTLDDLLNRVGSDFTYNYMQQEAEKERIRAAMALPGNSVSTPVSGIRGAIGAGLRAIADRYFTPGRPSAYNIPGYRRIGS